MKVIARRSEWEKRVRREWKEEEKRIVVMCTAMQNFGGDRTPSTSKTIVV